MTEHDSADWKSALERIKTQGAGGAVRVTQHAQQEMVEEGVSIDEVLEAIARGEILEHYAEHRRGACCLLGGMTGAGRPLHIVCTTAQPVVVLITVYEPKPPKWMTPWTRSKPR